MLYHDCTTIGGILSTISQRNTLIRQKRKTPDNKQPVLNLLTKARKVF
jgi:hypothetical protein